MTPELQNHFLNLYAMALADSDFDEREIAVLYKLGEERGLDRPTIDAMLLQPPAAADVEYPTTLAQKMEYLYDYARMIWADGVVHEDEARTLHKFCHKFGFEVDNVPTIVQLLLEAAQHGLSKTELLHFVTQNN